MPIFLDQVSANSLRNDRKRFCILARINALIVLSLAQQRAQTMGRLSDILLAHARPYRFQGWHRVVDYQYADRPLSARGSVVSETGGRFNIGDISPTLWRPFPALYLADSRALAFFEKYGQEENDPGRKSSAHEAVLAQPGSIASVQVRGDLEACVRVDDHKCLKKLAALWGGFQVPKEAIQLARQHGFKIPGIASTPRLMKKAIMQSNWRDFPLFYDMPSNPQYFGQGAWKAGVEAVLYPSSKGRGECLAVYPENFGNTTAYIEIEGACPPGMELKRLDQTTYSSFC